MGTETVTVSASGTATTQVFDTQDAQEIGAMFEGAGTMKVDVVWLQSDRSTEQARQTYSELTDGAAADSKIVIEAVTCKAPAVQFEITDTSGAENAVDVSTHAH